MSKTLQRLQAAAQHEARSDMVKQALLRIVNGDPGLNKVSAAFLKKVEQPKSTTDSWLDKFLGLQ